MMQLLPASLTPTFGQRPRLQKFAFPRGRTDYSDKLPYIVLIIDELAD